MAKGHSHRSTLKNDHKPFKSKHASKGQLKNQHKGKVEKATSGSAKANKVISKLERKNSAKQLKENKISETKLTRKIFEGSQGAEKAVTIIALTDDISTADIAHKLINSAGEVTGEEVVFTYPSVTNVKVQRFKSNLKVILPDQQNLMAVLDAAKISDFVIFGISAEKEVEQAYGEQLLRAITAQGVASVVGVMPNVVSAYPKRNLQMDIRQSLFSFFTHFFPDQEKLYALENESECSNCIRTIAQKFPKSVNWRDARGYLVADEAYWAPTEAHDGHLVVEGTVRGTGFNANRLVHIPGYGDFQIDRIEALGRGHRKEAMEVDENSCFLPDDQEPLEELNPEEIEMDEGYFEYDDNDFGVRMDGKNYFDLHDTSKKRFKMPTGTSDYQAKWLLDDVLEDASDVEEASDEEEAANMGEDDPMQEETTEYAPTEADPEDFMDLSPEEEQRQLQEFRALAKEDLEFPDELELDPVESGKERLASYRGIKSLGTCEWDYDELDKETPSVWKRLLRILNFKATRNRVMKEAVRETQVHIGTRARLYIRAPQYILERVNAKRAPFTVFGLFQHEHKLALVNFLFDTWEDYDTPVPSHEVLVAQYGPRRQVIQPIFNQASNNANNVHKFERFAHQGVTSIATAVAPVLFSNAPVIFFKQKADGSLELVGQGTFLNCDHSRVVCERAVLTGHPVKIHKRMVTVRYMFFNAEDINWFKAIPLFTKSGRTGFIKESLGTHGYYKATFDGKLTAQDTVGMSMYKRVWPTAATSTWLE